MKRKLVISKTPLRVSFFGGGTDIENYYLKKNGKVISTTIDKYVYVTIKEHGELFRRNFRLNYSKSENKNTLSKIENNIIRETLRIMKIKRPLYISSISDIPDRTGLGSSSSFTVGLIKALYAFEGKKISKKNIAELACKIEINILRNPIGKQDQYAATYGGLNSITFKKKGVFINPLKYKKNFIKMIFNNSILVFSGNTRSASKILKDQKRNHNLNLSNLNDLKDISEKFLKLSKKDLTINNFSKLLKNNWDIKKKLSKKINSRKIENLIKICNENGALAVKLLGAGGGGFIFVLIKKNNINLIKKKIKNFEFVSCKYEPIGSSIILEEKKWY